MGNYIDDNQETDPLESNNNADSEGFNILKWYQTPEAQEQIQTAREKFNTLTASERYIKAQKAYNDNEEIRKALEAEGKKDPRIKECLDNLKDPSQLWAESKDKFFDELKRKVQEEEDRLDRIEHHRKLIERLNESIILNGLMNQDRVHKKLYAHGLFKLSDGRFVQRVYFPRRFELITEPIENHLHKLLLQICNSPAQDAKRIEKAEPSLKHRVNINELSEREAIQHLTGSGRQKMNTLTPFIPEVNDNVLRRDTQKQFHIQFNNHLVLVDKDGSVTTPTETVLKFTLPDKYIDRDYTRFEQTPEGENSMVIEFLRKAIAGAEVERTPENPFGVSDLVKQTIGYLLYGVKFESDGYIICLVDETPDASKGGGSGKNMFTRLVHQWAKVLTIDARSIKAGDGSYLQALKEERIVLIDEVPNRFDYTILKSMTNSDVTIKKLYQDKYILESKNAPKMITTSNFAPTGIALDGGLKRRIRLLEFTNFFNDRNQLRTHFNCGLWPEAFTSMDYMQLDSFFLQCVKAYIDNDFKIQKTEPSRGLIEKSMQGSEEVLAFVEKHFAEFVVGEFVSHAIVEKQGVPYSDKQIENIKTTRQGCTDLRRVSKLIYEYSNMNPSNPLPKEWRLGVVLDAVMTYASARNYDVIKRYNLKVNGEQIQCLRVVKGIEKVEPEKRA